VLEPLSEVVELGVDPLVESLEPALQTVEPAPQTIEPAPQTIEPGLQTIEPGRQRSEIRPHGCHVGLGGEIIADWQARHQRLGVLGTEDLLEPSIQGSELGIGSGHKPSWQA
jgi:hypothetical protein